MTPRLVATDLDGTLLHSDGTVTARTRAVLDELDGLGVPVVFTTGRPIRWMEELWADVGGHGLAICSNGGIVYDVSERRVRDFSAVPREVGMELAEVLRAAVPGTTFAVEHTSGWASEHGFPRHPDDGETLRQGTWESIWTDDVVKVLAVHRDLDPEDFWRQVEAAVGTLVTTTWSSTFALVEISAAGIDQGHHAGHRRRRDGARAAGRRRVRRHAQRPADARVGRHLVRDGQRAPVGARRGRPPRAGE